MIRCFVRHIWARLSLVLVAGLTALAIPVQAQEAAYTSATEESTAEESAVGPWLDDSADRAVLDKGRTHLFGFRMAEAEQAFRQLAEEPNSRVAAYHHLATASFYKGMMSDQDAHFEEFFARSDSLKTLLDDEPNTPWNRHAEAETNLQRAIVAGKQGRYFRTALDARSAFKGFKNVVEDYPSFGDPQLGLGLLHLTIATLPSTYQRLLWVLGFRGDAEGGRAEIEYAAEHSRYNQVQAKISLAVADLVMYQERERGTARIEVLYDQYPDSPFFAYLYGYALIENRRADRAAGVLRAGVEQAERKDVFFVDYLEYFLAEALFIQNEFVEAETYYKRYIARHRGVALKAMAFWRLGVAVEMQGERDEAIPFYELTEAAREFDTDQVAQRHARLRIDDPLTPLDKRLLRGRNAFDGGHYDEAERILRPIYESTEASPAQKGEAAYRLARTLHVQGKTDEALSLYRWAAEHPGDAEGKWGAWSHAYIGEIKAERGQRKEAIEAYEQALAYDAPYDYHQALEQTAKLALERLKASS